eukprot:gene1029-9933_t
MNSFKEGWFTENPTLWPGQAISLEVEEVLFHEKSKYQDVLVFKSKTYGNVLVLDGVIQTTDRDEFAYQEMIVHLPMCSHPEPKNVLVIGGGDGGCLREVIKHPSVEKVTLCEIDKMVCDVSEKFLPNLSSAFKDKRVNFYFDDGCQYLKDHPNEFDVIIVDSSDPVGPAESLFGPEFFNIAKGALKKGGVLSTQAECMWLHMDIIANMKKFISKIFDICEYAYTVIPTYPSGTIGFFICKKENSETSSKPISELPKEEAEKLRYYSKEIHSSSFILPNFVKSRLK